VGYVGNYGVHEEIVQDYNEALPNAAGGTLTLQARRPIQTYGTIQESFNEGPSRYNALEAKLEKRYAQRNLHCQLLHLVARAGRGRRQSGTDNNDSPVVDLYNMMGSYTRSAYDRPLNDSLAVVWDLPYGKGKRFGSHAAAPLQFVLGDWQLTALNYLHQRPAHQHQLLPESTAQQLSTETSFLYRPNLVGTPVLGKGSRTPIAGQPGQYQYLDPTAVSVPTAANTPYGNCPRNVARAPGYADLDLGVHKRFPLGFEKAGLEFRAEAFDVFNHSNAQAPDSVATDAGYGIVNSYFPSRELQVGSEADLLRWLVTPACVVETGDLASRVSIPKTWDTGCWSDERLGPYRCLPSCIKMLVTQKVHRGGGPLRLSECGERLAAPMMRARVAPDWWGRR
jgi:hypothetical protein